MDHKRDDLDEPDHKCDEDYHVRECFKCRLIRYCTGEETGKNFSRNIIVNSRQMKELYNRDQTLFYRKLKYVSYKSTQCASKEYFRQQIYKEGIPDWKEIKAWTIPIVFFKLFQYVTGLTLMWDVFCNEDNKVEGLKMLDKEYNIYPNNSWINGLWVNYKDTIKKLGKKFILLSPCYDHYMVNPSQNGWKQKLSPVLEGLNST